MKYLSLFSGIFILLLSGCAIKPTITEADYAMYARVYRGAKTCQNDGYYSVSTRIRVQQTVMEMAANRHSSFSDVKMGQAIEKDDYRTPNRQDCEELAVLVGQYRSRQQPVYVAPAQSNMPVQTTCNRIGFQTYCTTY